MRDQRNHRITVSQTSWLGRLLVPMVIGESTRASQVTALHDQPRVSRCINDKYCLNAPVCALLLTRGRNTLKSCQTLNVKSLDADHVPFAIEEPRKKGVSPDIVQQVKSLKYVKAVSCVDHLNFVQKITNVPVLVPDLPVGGRLHQFWGKWAALGAGPKVIKILREGYTLPFWI